MTEQEFDEQGWTSNPEVIYQGVRRKVTHVGFAYRYVVLLCDMPFIEVATAAEIELFREKADDAGNVDGVKLCRDNRPCMKPGMQCEYCVLNE